MQICFKCLQPKGHFEGTFICMDCIQQSEEAPTGREVLDALRTLRHRHQVIEPSKEVASK